MITTKGGAPACAPGSLGFATIATSDCEGMYNKCLRYSVGTINAGKGDLHLLADYVAAPPPGQVFPATQRVYATDGSHEDYPLPGAAFLWHDCHKHYHFQGWTNTSLRGPITSSCNDTTTATACPVIANHANVKTSFCLEDYRKLEDGLAPFDADLWAYHNVDSFQQSWCVSPNIADPAHLWEGINAGYEDVYRDVVYGQLISLDGLGSGTYWLEVEVNPVLPQTGQRQVYEADTTNNVSRVTFTVP